MHLEFAARAQELAIDPALQQEDDEAEFEDVPRPCVALMHGGDWIDQLPIAWLSTWDAHEVSKAYDARCVHALLTWLQTERDESLVSYPVAWIELAAILTALDVSVPDRTCIGGRTVWVPSDTMPAALYRQPTVATIVRFVREIFRDIHRCFGFDIQFVRDLDLSSHFVHAPQQGIILCLSTSAWQRGQTLLKAFTSTRAVRTSNDLARPF